MHTQPKTESSVFIIESLRRKDENAERFEGRMLHYILRLANKEAKYIYIRTLSELKMALTEFERSRMRYLHVSCHGDAESIALTLDDLPFIKLGDLVRPYLYKRRLFFSACEVVNEDLAEAVIPHSGCNSIIGPEQAVSFGDAAIMWASFYHLVFRTNPDSMNKQLIKVVLERICETFEVSFGYYARSSTSPKGFRKQTFR